jgi:hypothetical protein
LDCGCMYEEHFVTDGKSAFVYLEHSNCELND